MAMRPIAGSHATARRASRREGRKQRSVADDTPTTMRRQSADERRDEELGRNERADEGAEDSVEEERQAVGADVRGRLVNGAVGCGGITVTKCDVHELDVPAEIAHRKPADAPNDRKMQREHDAHEDVEPPSRKEPAHAGHGGPRRRGGRACGARSQERRTMKLSTSKKASNASATHGQSAV
jgi:hypothetical protein